MGARAASSGPDHVDPREEADEAEPEQAFYMVGTIEEAFEKAKTLQ